MISEFETALQQILSGDNPPDTQLLAMLSGPTRAESAVFSQHWHTLPPERRREIIARMVELSEERFEFDFVALFRRCLNDSDAEVRRYAIEGLWEDERRDLIDPLIHILQQDPDLAVRAAAATSLGRFILMSECEELDERHGARVRAALEGAISAPDVDQDVMRRAIEALSFINDNVVRDLIDRAYESTEQRMRESAVFAMGRNADARWVEIVLQELDSTSAAMRYEAARAAGEMQIEKAVSQLIRLAEDVDAEVGAMAVWALGQIGGRRAQSALERWAASSDEALAAVAAEALDEMELLSQPMDLLVHEFSDELVEEMASWDDDENDKDLEDEEEDDESEEDEWPEDFLDIN